MQNQLRIGIEGRLLYTTLIATGRYIHTLYTDTQTTFITRRIQSILYTQYNPISFFNLDSKEQKNERKQVYQIPQRDDEQKLSR